MCLVFFEFYGDLRDLHVLTHSCPTRRSADRDSTTCRGDTPDHPAKDPRRVTPSGAPYQPFHDVQAIVDGEAAALLGEIARERWHTAKGVDLGPLQPAGDPWPAELKPDLTDVAVGVARPHRKRTV